MAASWPLAGLTMARMPTARSYTTRPRESSPTGQKAFTPCASRLAAFGQMTSPLRYRIVNLESEANVKALVLTLALLTIHPVNAATVEDTVLLTINSTKLCVGASWNL